MTPRIGSLCSGYGGLDAGVQLALGGTVAWHSDTDPGASKILAHHWPDVPNHGDLTTTDWSAVEPVDIITAGWPCQPWSLAGKRKGAQDERAIWPAVANAVRHLRPRYVVLENVAAIVVLGELARAVSDLAGLGYVGSWRCLRASDVGATHGRNRCFIAATDPLCGGRAGGASDTGRGAVERDAARRSGSGTSADTAHVGHERGGESRGGRSGPEDSGGVAPDTNGPRSQGAEPAAGRHLPDGRPAAHTDCATGPVAGGIAPGSPQGVGAEAFRGTRPGGGVPAPTWGQYEPAIRRWESVLGRCAPAPTEPGRTGNPRLSPRFVEWMQGLPAGHVTDVPGLSRNEQLKALGNGVVPQQAAAAIRMLLDVEEAAA